MHRESGGMIALQFWIILNKTFLVFNFFFLILLNLKLENESWMWARLMYKQAPQVLRLLVPFVSECKCWVSLVISVLNEKILIWPADGHMFNSETSNCISNWCTVWISNSNSTSGNLRKPKQWRVCIVSAQWQECSHSSTASLTVTYLCLCVHSPSTSPAQDAPRCRTQCV